MDVLVIGGGGREHALCMGLMESPSVMEIHCAPGNAGTSIIAWNHDIDVNDAGKVVALVKANNIDLVVVGPEAPLCSGLADRLQSEGIPCFGPVARLANLEGSKLHAKQVMKEAGVPTAEFLILDSNSDLDSALDKFSENPWVIKRDVLAGGKGVVVTEDRDEALEFIESSITSDGMVLLEAFLPGEEASMLVVIDETDFVTLPCSQDHKRAFDGDEGPNTGGMGAYAPAPVVDESVYSKAIERIVEPMHDWCSSQKTPYRGVLYVGLMIDSSGDPYVVEFNVRFGDPECQVTIPLIDSDLGEMLMAAAGGRLGDIDVEFANAHALTVVLAAEGYPGKVVKGRRIEIGDIENGWINHAGTGLDVEDELISTGGRVLSCTGISDSLEGAREIAYAVLEEVELEGSHHRKDIGSKAL